MNIGVVRETFPGERRVALVPDSVAALAKKNHSVVIESGAGDAAGFLAAAYAEKGARVLDRRADVFAAADVILQVRSLGANTQHGRADLEYLKPNHTLIGLCEPLTEGASAQLLAERGLSAFSMELMPRITRAQSMDVLSSMATIAGYKAVLIAADAMPRMFPMLMTAAGTVTPARVFIVGVGVAGLMAIATARRLGALVKAYDVRPAVKDQVKSLGAEFVEMALDTAAAEGAGGYAKEMGEDFLRRQREMMTKVVAESDVMITTAAVPGKRAPILVTTDMIRRMAPGSVVVDLAAERGGNCEPTRPGETVLENGVSVLGPLNLPATIPYHASQMYAKNITTFLLHLAKDGQLAFNLDDEITRETLICRGGQITHPRVREALGLAPAAAAPQGGNP